MWWIYVLLILAPLVLLWAFLRPKKPVRDTTVLAGPSGGGKTALFLHLSDKHHPTVTSSSCTVGETKWGKLVDTPGHPKLEAMALAQINDQCKRVVFVVDGTNLANVGPLLYRVLLLCEQHGIPCLVAGNKYDLFSTVSIRKVKQVLQQEIGEIRSSKDKGLGENDEWLGGEGEFRFEDLGVDVEFESGSVKKGRVSEWE